MKTVIFDPPVGDFAPSKHMSTQAQQKTIVIEFEVSNKASSTGPDIYGYTWNVVSGPFYHKKRCTVIYDTYSQALESAWSHFAKLQHKKPYWYGDVVILGLPPDATLTICDDPQTFRPHTTLTEMERMGRENLEASQRYWLNGE